MNNNLNILQLSKSYANIFQNYYSVLYRKLWQTDSNYFYSFDFDFSQYEIGSIDDIDIKLVDSNNSSNTINFKNIVDSSELAFINKRLIYKASRSLNQSVEGCYYMKFTFGETILYTNIVTFKNLGFATKASSFNIVYTKTSNKLVELTFSSIIEPTQITVNWGEGTTETKTVKSTNTTFSYDYSGKSNANYTISISGKLENISTFSFDDDEFLEVNGLSYLSNIYSFSANNYAGQILDCSKNLNLNFMSLVGSTLTDASLLPLSITDLYLPTSKMLLENNFVHLKNINYLWHENSDIEQAYLYELINPEYIIIKNTKLNFITGIGTNIYSKLTALNTVDLSGNNFTRISNLQYLITKEFATYGNIYDFSNNGLNATEIDRILEMLAAYNVNRTTEGLQVDVSGFNKYNGETNSIPTYCIFRLQNEGYGGGNNYVVGDILTDTLSGLGAQIRVDAIGSGGLISKSSIINKGAGYKDVTTGGFTGGSGTGNGVIGWSAYWVLNNSSNTTVTVNS